ncbi:hypothetical protein JCM19233_5370 [Vibrio astriarenae]|nr:hypothetical protein JCM19233_5370 [Vibrio sp. C7]
MEIVKNSSLKKVLMLRSNHPPAKISINNVVSKRGKKLMVCSLIWVLPGKQQPPNRPEGLGLSTPQP